MISQMNNTYYRPEWTCGKFHKEKSVAIMYNLIEGMSYFFEEESAILIGIILSTKRNDKIDVQKIQDKITIELNEITDFFDELLSLGIITKNIYTNTEIEYYRKSVLKNRLNNNKQEIDTEDTHLNLDSAERAYTDALGENAITNIMLELTYRCNEKCIHCYNPGAVRNQFDKNQRGERNEINLLDYKRIIEEFEEFGLFKVTLTGGEPFVRKDIWELLDYLYEKEIAIDIFTNGQAIINNADKIASYYPRTVSFSLYSGIPEDHDKITQVKGSYIKTISAIEQFAQFATPINIKCVVMKPNIQSYFTVKEIAKQYGIIVQFDLNVTDSVDGDTSPSESLRLTQEMLEIVLQDTDISKQLSYIEVQKGEMTRGLGDKVCGAGYDSFSITPEGYLQPCIAFPLTLGNLSNNNLKSIITNNGRLNHWRNLTPDDFKECYSYDYCSFCRICPGNNFVANGDPVVPSENNCAIAKYKFELSEKMNKGYKPLNGKTLEQCLTVFQTQEIIIEKRLSVNYRDN